MATTLIPVGLSLFDEMKSLMINTRDNITTTTTTIMSDCTNTNNSCDNDNNNYSQPAIYYVNPDDWRFFQNTLNVGRFLMPLEIVVGLFSNIIAFAVLCRKAYRCSSTAVYLRALAIFDIGTLATVGGGMIFQTLVLTMKWACLIMDYAIIIFINSSNWTLILITIERLLAILMPHRVSRLMTKKTALISVVTLFFCMLLIDSHDLFFFKDAGWDQCQLYYDTEPARSIIRIFRIIHTLKFVIIPLPVISIGNIVIIVHLHRQNKLMKSARLYPPPTTAGKMAANAVGPTKTSSGVNHIGDGPTKNAILPKKIGVGEKVSESSSKVVRRDRERGLALTLLALNCCFLFTRVPYEAHNMSLGIPPRVNLNLMEYSVRVIMGIISLFNNVLNVFLYFATGSRFRNEFKAMCKEIGASLRSCCCIGSKV